MQSTATKHVRNTPYHKHKLSLREGPSSERAWKGQCSCGWVSSWRVLPSAAAEAARHHLAMVRQYYKDSGIPL